MEYKTAGFRVATKSNGLDSKTSNEEIPAKKEITLTITNLEETKDQGSEESVVNVGGSSIVKMRAEVLVADDPATPPERIGTELNNELVQFIEGLFKENNHKLKTTEILSKLKARGFKNILGGKLSTGGIENFLKGMSKFEKTVMGKTAYFQMREENSLFPENDVRPNSIADVTGG